jgi:hypothetical protein
MGAVRDALLHRCDAVQVLQSRNVRSIDENSSSPVE